MENNHSTKRFAMNLQIHLDGTHSEPLMFCVEERYQSMHAKVGGLLIISGLSVALMSVINHAEEIGCDAKLMSEAAKIIRGNKKIEWGDRKNYLDIRIDTKKDGTTIYHSADFNPNQDKEEICHLDAIHIASSIRFIISDLIRIEVIGVEEATQLLEKIISAMAEEFARVKVKEVNGNILKA